MFDSVKIDSPPSMPAIRMEPVLVRTESITAGRS
jgi:hypothetical protein